MSEQHGRLLPVTGVKWPTRSNTSAGIELVDAEVRLQRRSRAARVLLTTYAVLTVAH